MLQVGKAGSKSFYAFSMQSIFAEGNTMDIKIYLTGLFSQSCLEETDSEMWRVPAWSFHWLYMGRWPPVEWHGQPWADPTSSEARLANTP